MNEDEGFCGEPPVMTVIRWQNDNVMVFAHDGQQIGKLQGRYPDVREAVLAASDEYTIFRHGQWNQYAIAVPKEEW